MQFLPFIINHTVMGYIAKLGLPPGAPPIENHPPSGNKVADITFDHDVVFHPSDGIGSTLKFSTPQTEPLVEVIQIVLYGDENPIIVVSEPGTVTIEAGPLPGSLLKAKREITGPNVVVSITPIDIPVDPVN